jgi:hypothetical protein
MWSFFCFLNRRFFSVCFKNPRGQAPGKVRRNGRTKTSYVLKVTYWTWWNVPRKFSLKSTERTTPYCSCTALIAPSLWPWGKSWLVQSTVESGTALNLTAYFVGHLALKKRQCFVTLLELICILVSTNAVKNIRITSWLSKVSIPHATSIQKYNCILLITLQI